MQYEYYSILEIERTATDAEIKRAYRKKAMECHPDRHGGDKGKETEFKKLNEAYSTLSDPQKRAHYDRFGSSEGMGGFGGFGGFQGGFQGGFDAQDLGDIFSQFFGGGFGGMGSRRRMDIGEDIEVRLRISLEDAIRGVSRKISYERTIPGPQGWEKKIEKIEKTIEVPAGIEDGMSIKMRDEGNVGTDGAGDLYISFTIPHSEWGLIRKGADLHFVVAISPAEAALGTTRELDIPIIGKKSLRVKAGTAYGHQERFTREGIPSVEGRHQWDLIIHIEIAIPTKLTSDQKRLYEALLQSEWGSVKKGWLEEFFGG